DVVSDSNATDGDIGTVHVGNGLSSPSGLRLTATATAPEPATPLANHGHRSFWQHGSAPAGKNRQTDKRFEAMTSPELL
ncbi:hypothetical protein GGI00_006599, partial [Coemansia sp. RSA 2681]